MTSAEPGGTSSFAAELRAQRTARGWTQVELGKRIGYSGSFVSDVERGERAPGEDFAQRCDEVFELPGTFIRLYEDLRRNAYPPFFAPVLPPRARGRHDPRVEPRCGARPAADRTVRRVNHSSRAPQRRRGIDSAHRRCSH